MRRAVKLSEQGFPAPNPPVGCVLVRDGQWIADGFPTYAGGPHAEAVALATAGENARGATAYVTLEPCNHVGRTAACSESLIQAGVSRVVVAVRDPNPIASGGLERLVAAGVKVETGVEADLAERAMSAFLFAMRHRRPYVVAKAAFGLDGRIALPSGESQWITGPNARRAGHALRARLGAVLVGWRTVAADNPRLTARLPGVVNQPLRIVLDPHRRLSGKEAVFNDEAPTRHMTGTIELSTVLSDLFEEGVTGLLVEGGAATISGFLTAGFVNRIEAFVAPKILGDGPSWVSGLNVQNLNGAVALGDFQITRRGSDIQIGADVVQKTL